MAKQVKPKERVIVTNIYDVDDWKDEFKDWCKNNCIEEKDADIHEYINRCLEDDFDDTRMNLDVECGDIIAIADLGLWDGRHSAYQIIKADKVADIFRVGMRSIDYYKFYVDRYDVKADLIHHDGTNKIIFREIKPNVNISQLTDKLYNQEDVEQELITRLTKSLKPKVCGVFGW